MRVGIDLSVLSQPMTGVPRYAFLLAENLKRLQSKHEFVFVRCEGQIPFWSRHVAFARDIKRQGIDVFHGPANVLPGFLKTKSVITIHDLAIYKHPEWFPTGQWFATKFVVPRSIRRADKIIVPSEVTKRDLMKLFAVSEEKIVVIPLGVEERFFAGDERRATSDKKYILFVGTLDPRKNFKGVIEAYRLLPGEMREKYALRSVGPGLDYVPDEELPGLYQGASVFVYPSFYEGFGLPVLEAMAAGVPVVTSRGSAMAEFAGGVAELVDPADPNTIAAAISKLIRDGAYYSEKVSTGVSRALRYTWERTARETLGVYQGLIN